MVPSPGLLPLILPAALALGGLLLQAAAPGLAAEGMPAEALRILGGVAGWLGLAWTGARIFDRVLQRAARVTRRATPYPRLLSDMLRAVLFAAAIAVIVTQVLGQPALGLVTTSSVAVAVIGFALRNIISDLFSGLALGIDAPYRIGDWIETAEGCAGRVTEMGWRTTHLVTREGIALTVPNGLVAAHRLANYGARSRYRVALRLPLDPALPVERAKRILLAAALDAERRFPGLAPDVLLGEVTDGVASYLLRFHVPDYGQEVPCRDAVASAALRALQHAGLLPGRPPQRLLIERAAAPSAGGAALLRRIPLFAGFPAEERAALEAALQERLVPRGAVVVRQGEAGDSLFLLAEGALEVRAVREGTEMAPDRLVPGEVFGEMSLLTGQPRSATVTAATEAVVFELRREDLDPVLRRRPELAEKLAAIMAGRQTRNAGAPAPGGRLPAAEVPVPEDLLGRLRAFFRLG
ncbi:mechanosensitive ion channel family protein [Paracraurococcus lichenis]|uniref:Mechanosensitive ion channel family protein n=1 Tax=Paracraurococcus lichenis TaxID=3064888 RepID=A0ABT9DW70_9PROT|nr:mechanosensitive ion channel family protein [Paracraurococcus sp. LOR1-02]MDO9708137.1 mechanosensitive ion channel family protein [Paracraurococcus sp. LOR1-02]